jgi:hypothetical protein
MGARRRGGRSGAGQPPPLLPPPKGLCLGAARHPASCKAVKSRQWASPPQGPLPVDIGPLPLQAIHPGLHAERTQPGAWVLQAAPMDAVHPAGPHAKCHAPRRHLAGSRCCLQGVRQVPAGAAGLASACRLTHLIYGPLQRLVLDAGVLEVVCSSRNSTSNNRAAAAHMLLSAGYPRRSTACSALNNTLRFSRCSNCMPGPSNAAPPPGWCSVKGFSEVGGR